MGLYLTKNTAMTNVKRWVEVAIHVIIWLIGFYLVANYVNSLGYIKRGNGFFIYPVVLGTFVNIFLFYLVVFILIPKYSSRKFWKQLLLYLLFLLAVLTLVESLIDYYLLPNYYSSIKEPYSSQVFITLIINIFFLALALGYGFTRVWIKSEQQRHNIKSERLSAELNYLKAQVNPHFLFNMLNLAFASSNKHGDEFTADLIEKIASQMRYMLYDSNVDKVTVMKEIEYINDFISLQKLRMSNEMPVTVSYKTHGDFHLNSIAPLLLIPFIENAFKHGLSFNETSEISITITCKNNVLTLNVLNSIITRSTVHLEGNASGFGLKNVRKRLALIYPDKHSISVSIENEKFIVHLQIQLN
jgi:sensor histidine kinase YesM